MLDVAGVSYAYGPEIVLRDVSLRVGAGEFVALIGPNAAGKSTLLRIVLGLLEPDAGTVALFGQPPRRWTDRARVGYVPQRPALAANLVCTVEEIVASGRLAHRPFWRRFGAADREAIDHALEVVDLVDRRGARVTQLSGGQQQRAFIARALASGPDLLVLDEPVAGVDAASQERFRDALAHHVRVHDGSVLLVSHELGPVRPALDRVIVLNRTVRYDGVPEGLAATTEDLAGPVTL